MNTYTKYSDWSQAVRNLYPKGWISIEQGLAKAVVAKPNGELLVAGVWSRAEQSGFVYHRLPYGDVTICLSAIKLARIIQALESRRRHWQQYKTEHGGTVAADTLIDGYDELIGELKLHQIALPEPKDNVAG